ncbi:hypothetical protein ACN6A9_01910 [Bacillus safensis]|uniref:hypothetical protein n=1 Tax=Bacillus altitudinis TaxID=293387 RepID=UPI000D7CEFA2|nr:hypothetical protein [Bacillus altitudinis]PYH27429.1 hypothetical protein US8_00051 [Bacillus altitudinis]
MNFETKYLIRWGIPGWVFLLMSLWPVAIFHANLPTDNPVESISVIFSTAAIGIVIGYLIHQMYFAWSWILGFWRRSILTSEIAELIDAPQPVENEKWYKFRERNKLSKKRANEYFTLEFEWQNRLSKVKEDSRRDYIAKRYAHLLSTTHSLGALCFALLLSLIINITHYILMIVNILSSNSLVIINIIIISFILFPCYINHKYFSENVEEFRNKFLKDFYKNS